MKIACILTVFPSVSETFIFADLRALKEAGHDVGLLHFMDGSQEIWQRDAKLLRDGVVRGGPVLSPSAIGALFGYLLRRPWRLLSTLFWIAFTPRAGLRPRLKTVAILPKCVQFAADCERWGADRVHATWSNHAAVAALVIKRLNGTPFSMAAHAGQDVFREPVMLRDKVAATDFVAVCNEATLARLQEVAEPKDRAKLHLLSHGVDVELFENDGAREVSDPPRVVFVGRLAYGKGLEYLLRAAERLTKEGVGFSLDIYGDGPEAAAARAAIERAELPATMHGAVNQVEVADALRDADLLVLPSELRKDGGREGLPNVLLEAMAAGVPVVASRIASVEQAVRDGETGRLVPQRDPDALARAIRSVFEEPDATRRMADAARMLVREKYDRRDCGRRFASLFEGIA